jgi:hypothetical protein
MMMLRPDPAPLNVMNIAISRVNKLYSLLVIFWGLAIQVKYLNTMAFPPNVTMTLRPLTMSRPSVSIAPIYFEWPPSPFIERIII